MCNPFKVGDIVKIKECERDLFKLAGYDVDKTYLVEIADRYYVRIRKCGESYARGWYCHRFELVSGDISVVTNCSDYQNNTDLSADDKDVITKCLEGIKYA